jgi:hypothetical protein
MCKVEYEEEEGLDRVVVASVGGGGRRGLLEEEEEEEEGSMGFISIPRGGGRGGLDRVVDDK